MVYDSMHGVQGPYARKVLVDELGAPESPGSSGVLGLRIGQLSDRHGRKRVGNAKEPGEPTL